ncbi:MAG: cobalamin biosynthesis protein [Actinobacteria bacterium]|nr:MAG: cobalamin biosynthesis protein [Actinomycetota bacterium]
MGIAVLALLSPIGLILPAWLRAGAAWGEWSSDELRGLVGYVPRGLGRLEGVWRSLLPDYTVPGLGGPLGEQLGYVISAFVGVGIVVGLTWLLGRALAKKERRRDS